MTAFRHSRRQAGVQLLNSRAPAQLLERFNSRFRRNDDGGRMTAQVMCITMPTLNTYLTREDQMKSTIIMNRINKKHVRKSAPPK